MLPRFNRLSVVIAAICIVMTGSLLGGEEKRLESRVEVRDGVPTFVINGRPHPGVCYSSYDCGPENLSRRVRQFSEAGCDVFNFVVEISGYGFSRPMWVGKDRWDFSELDRRARTILDAAPNAMLLPRIYIGSPEWLRDENPGRLSHACSRTIGERGGTFWSSSLLAWNPLKSGPCSERICGGGTGFPRPRQASRCQTERAYGSRPARRVPDRKPHLLTSVQLDCPSSSTPHSIPPPWSKSRPPQGSLA